MTIHQAQLSELRARFLSLQGDAAIEIHGWLLGVACAVERQRGVDPADADRLIAELRASKGPPDFPAPRDCNNVSTPPQASAVLGDGLAKASTPLRSVVEKEESPEFTGEKNEI